MTKAHLHAVLVLTGLLLSSDRSLAEEGFWPFSSLPFDQMKRDLGSAPTGNVLGKLEQATLQLGRYCTAALAGPDWLLVTNYHCISDCIKDPSGSADDFPTTGFNRGDPALEPQCPGLFAERPLSDVDVTERFRSVLKNLTGSEYADRLNEEIGAATGECQAADDTRSCRIVQCFNGAVFRLQAFKVYRDIRLVFAPEYDSANFGGDVDNFDFPRFGFDVALLRIYENDQPAQAEGWLTWRGSPHRNDEPLFVAGYPGYTYRHFTVAQLRSMRDGYLPWYMNLLAALRGRLLKLAETRGDKGEALSNLIYEVENSFKSSRGEFSALADDKFMSARELVEKNLRARIATDPDLTRSVGTAFEEISEAERIYREIYWKYTLRRDVAPSALLRQAISLVTAVRQFSKLEDQRLPEYVNENMHSIESSLMADIQIDRDLEVLTLGFGLSKLREHLGADHPFVSRVLGQESPEALAVRAIDGTRLRDPAVRKKFLSGRLHDLETSADPLLRLAVVIEEEYAVLDRRFSEEVDGPQSLAHRRISEARDAGDKRSRYPDADGSLRLTYGKVSGWTEVDGRAIPACTIVKGFSERASKTAPFIMVGSWATALRQLDEEEPFNCVTTHDVVGGFSGSVAVDMDGNIVGLVFDGNLPSLGGTYFYDGTRNREIIVAASLIQSVLADVYKFELVKE